MGIDMREKFEKLPSVAKYLKFVFWNSETKGYCNNSGNPVPLDFATFINGAWYAYQEQEKRIDAIRRLAGADVYHIPTLIKELKELLK